MQALDLNLSTRPFRNNTPLWVGYGVAFLALAFFTASNVKSYRDHLALVNSLESDIQQLERDRRDLTQRDGEAGTGITGHDVKLLRVRADKANEVIEWRAFSWTNLFNRMEQIKPWDVYLREVKPIFRGTSGQTAELGFAGPKSVPVMIEGVSKTHKAFRDLERKLIESPYFNEVRPEKTHRDLNSEIAFTLRFTYFPDVVVEDQAAPASADVADAAEPGAEPAAEPAVAAGSPVVAVSATPTDELPAMSAGPSLLSDADGDEQLPRIPRRRPTGQAATLGPPPAAADADGTSADETARRPAADDGSEEPAEKKPPQRSKRRRVRDLDGSRGDSGS